MADVKREQIIIKDSNGEIIFDEKLLKAKVIDILEYKLPLEEIFERNLIIITHA